MITAYIITASYVASDLSSRFRSASLGELSCTGIDLDRLYKLERNLYNLLFKCSTINTLPNCTHDTQ